MTGYENKARRARFRLLGIGTVAVAALAVAGTVAVSLTSHDAPGRARAKTPPSTASSAASAPASIGDYTPAKAPRVPLLKPTRHSDGIGTGFEHSSLGATSAAVSYWEDLAFLDDITARKQWAAIASKDSPETIDQGVSAVRKLREGAGLPPSGGSPEDVTFTTSVKAVLTRSLDETGDVVDVWMVYDRYADVRAKSTDDNPLRDQVTHLVLKWETGDWKVTTETKTSSHLERWVVCTAW